MKATISIPVVVRTQDNGDGGYSITAYNTEQELLDNHHLYQEASTGDKPKIAKDIFAEDDPYENGYISFETIDIELVYDGTVLPVDPPKLAKPLHFHAGQ